MTREWFPQFDHDISITTIHVADSTHTGFPDDMLDFPDANVLYICEFPSFWNSFVSDKNYRGQYMQKLY